MHADPDLVLTGGKVIDGAGNAPISADIAVADGQILAIGDLTGVHAARRIDVSGLYVCPGFIDMHAHSDLAVLSDRAHLAKLSQGFTTEVLGQDGLSYAPADERILPGLQAMLRGWNGEPDGLPVVWPRVADYFAHAERVGLPVNIAYLVPHGNLRLLCMEDPDREATDAELAAMADVLRSALADGAVGMSAGLTYSPAMFASDDEIAFLAAVVSEADGFYAPHHRGYGRYAMEQYDACLRIAAQTGVPLHLTHAQLSFPQNRGRAPELLRHIDDAIAEGLEVTMDSYPFLASSTFLAAILPPWAQWGSISDRVELLRDVDARARIRRDIEVDGHAAYHDVPVDWSSVVVSAVARPENEPYVGISIADAAATAGMSEIDVFCDLLIADEFGTTCVHHAGNEENLTAILQHPNHMAGSDGILVGARPHPRGWSTIPRYFAHYVRDEGLLRVEEAVRKFTSLPAQRIGAWDRGVLRPGMRADITVLDMNGLRETATYEQPAVPPEGLPYVIVNGKVAIDDGHRTEELAGAVLRRTQPKGRDR